MTFPLATHYSTLGGFYVTVIRKLTRPVPESIAADAVDHLAGFPTVVVDVPYCAEPQPLRRPVTPTDPRVRTVDGRRIARGRRLLAATGLWSTD